MRQTPLLILALAGAGISPLGAQSGPGSGLWLTGGIGVGIGKVGCDVCRGSWELAPSVQLGVGGRINSFLRIGVEGNGWMRNDPEFGVRNLMAGIGAVLYWSPGAGAYYVKAGVGPLFFRATDSDVPDGDEAEPAITSNAIAGHMGFGYEVGTGRVTFVPFVNITASVYGNLHQASSRLTDVGLNLLQFGVGVRWR